MTAVALDAVRPVTRVDTVVEHIRDLIEHSGLKPGNRLPGEHELAARFDVSRSVVREAISRLQTIGLLTAVRGRGGGTFVGDQDAVLGYASVVRSTMSICHKDARQFAEFRAALEVWSARRAAEVATDDDVAELEELCDRVGIYDGADEDAILADFRIHRKLAKIAGNEVILHTLEVSREFIKASIRETGPHDPDRSRSQHRAIVEAIRERDPEAAEQAMRRHMDSVIRYLPSNEPAVGRIANPSRASRATLAGSRSD